MVWPKNRENERRIIQISFCLCFMQIRLWLFNNLRTLSFQWLQYEWWPFIRNQDKRALFVAIWTRIFLKEKLTNSKIVGLLILIAGVVGLSIPNNSSDDKTGFSLLAAILALVAALVSSLRNYSVKYLGKKKISGDNITFGAVIGAGFIKIIIGAFLCIGGWGFNATNYNNYCKEYMDEITWQRFLWSLLVGFNIYFSLSFTANGNQKGYAG